MMMVGSIRTQDLSVNSGSLVVEGEPQCLAGERTVFQLLGIDRDDFLGRLKSQGGFMRPKARHLWARNFTSCFDPVLEVLDTCLEKDADHAHSAHMLEVVSFSLQQLKKRRPDWVEANKIFVDWLADSVKRKLVGYPGHDTTSTTITTTTITTASLAADSGPGCSTVFQMLEINRCDFLGQLKSRGGFQRAKFRNFWTRNRTFHFDPVLEVLDSCVEKSDRPLFIDDLLQSLDMLQRRRPDWVADYKHFVDWLTESVKKAETRLRKSLVCSAFRAHAVEEQCSTVSSLEKLGTFPDSIACGEVCKRLAATTSEACCIYTKLKECVAYAGADHIFNALTNLSTKEPYRGQATVCKVVSTPADEGPEGPAIFSTEGTGQMKVASHGEALFRNIKPSEIKQGQLGDCWLLAGVSSLSRFPSAVRKLFLQQFRSSTGIYNIRLFDAKVSRWKWLSIDERLPSANQGPLFAQLAADRSMWVLLLEKAAAQLAGRNYSKLAGGWTEKAFAAFTGSQNFTVYKKSGPVDSTKCNHTLPRTWDVARQVKHHKYSINARVSYRKFKWHGTTVAGLWADLVDAMSKNHMMTASIRRYGNATNRSEIHQGKGLYSGHAYSIIQARELSTSHFNKACIEEISVTYTCREELETDAQFLKEVWWLPGKRFTGHMGDASWTRSLASRHGVQQSWNLSHEDAADFYAALHREGLWEPFTVRFQGVVDPIACNPDEHQRTGRGTEESMMQITTLPHGATLRLVQVRNPWGNAERWTGSWGDEDEDTWQKHSDVAEILGFAPHEDGMWWMTLEEFVLHFDKVAIGGVDMLRFDPDFS